MIKIKRRNLLLGLGILGAGAVMSPGLAGAGAPRKLSILVPGGTGFIGPHIVREALGRSHELTVFNRGRSDTDLFPEVRKLVGARIPARRRPLTPAYAR